MSYTCCCWNGCLASQEEKKRSKDFTKNGEQNSTIQTRRKIHIWIKEEKQFDVG